MIWAQDKQKQQPPPTIGDDFIGALLTGLVIVPATFGLRGLWWALRQWRVDACLVLVVFATFLLTPIAVLVLLLALAVAAIALCIARPRTVMQAGKGRARKTFYAHGWNKSMTLCGLMKRDGSTVLVPRLVSVRCGAYFDHLTLHLQPGQTRQIVQDATDGLRHTFGSPACRVHSVQRKWYHGRGTRVRVDFQRQDALATVVARLEIPEEVNLEAVAIGRTEYGNVWSINLLGTHYLVGGATGSGKGSVLWSIVRGVAPAVRDGSVELWGIDMKGGQELIHCRGMFKPDCYVAEGADIDEVEALLAKLVEVMKERSNEFAKTKSRKPTVNVTEPLILCVFDEMADATTCADSKQRGRINGMLAMLCRRGRSVGITMLMLVQDGRIDAIPFRRQVPHGIGLRLDEPFEVDAICGHSAFKAGALCTEIPGAPEPGQPLDGRGIAYMTTLGVKTPLRVRASYITDDDLAEMERLYPAYDRTQSTVDFDALEQEFADSPDDEERPASRP